MSLPPETLRIAQAILAAPDEDFCALTDLARLDPARHWRGADLRGVDFASSDLAGFAFQKARLQGANLAKARGLSGEMFADAQWDARTVWPPGFHAVRQGWAQHWGTDQYGPWASFSVPDAQNHPVTQRLRYIPPGSFRMGSPPDEPDRYDNEGPQHLVTLAQGFWLFDTPCTQALWRAVMGDNPSRFQSPTRPVEQVNLYDVRIFLENINALVPGLSLALPSEAQWEYACRAGTETATYAHPQPGADFGIELDDIAWYGGNSGMGWDLNRTHPYARGGTRVVALKQPNRWGLHDMLGNVWEWCAGTWYSGYEDGPTDGSAWRAARAAAIVVRGGAWGSQSHIVRAAYRGSRDPDGRDDNLGFRCADFRRERSASGSGGQGGAGPKSGAKGCDGQPGTAASRAAVVPRSGAASTCA